MGSASTGISTWSLSRIREICSGPLPSMQRSKTRLTIWAASSSRIHLSLPLLVAPSAVFVQRANGTHDMKVRIGNADVLLVERMNGKVHYHTPAHKVLQQKLPCQSDVLLHGKLVLQGNVKAVRKLRFLSAFSFLHRVPEGFTVCILRWRMRWQQDFRAEDAQSVSIYSGSSSSSSVSTSIGASFCVTCTCT